MRERQPAAGGGQTRPGTGTGTTSPCDVACPDNAADVYGGAVAVSLFGAALNAGECYCGDALQAGPVATPEAGCNMACSGDATERRGGPSRLSVYSAS